MNDERNDVTKPDDTTEPDEPLVQSMPDPAGPPQAVEKDDDVLRGLSVLGVVLVAGGGLLLPLLASTGATAGATRSTKIQWEQRQAEIQRVISEDRGLAPTQDQSGCSEQGAGDRGGR